MAIDWKELHKKYGEKEKAEIAKEEKEQEVPVINTSVPKHAAIIQFDKTHVPEYKPREQYLKGLPKEVQKCVVLQFPVQQIAPKYRQEVEAYYNAKDTAIRTAKGLQKCEHTASHEHAYRVSLIKSENEDLNKVLTKSAKEWEQDARDGKQIPEIVITSPYQEKVGAPVPVNEFLDKTDKDTLFEVMKDEQGKKTYLIDSVYDRKDERELEYHSSCIQVQKEREEKQTEPVFFSERDNTLRPMSERPEELEAALKEANEELLDKDLYEFSDAGVSHDTVMLGDAQNVATQKNSRIRDAGAAEQERFEWGRDTGFKGPAVLDAIRDDEWSNASATPKTKEQYHSELYNMTQDISELSGEEAAMEKEAREEQYDRAPDTYDEDLHDQDMQEPEPEPEPEEEKPMSYRERIEAEDREFWEEDLERTF